MNEWQFERKGSRLGQLLLAVRRWNIQRGIQEAGLARRRVKFEGVRFHYYESRAGKPPLVLLHGFLDSANTWRKLFPLLEPHFDLYALDLPGSGETRLAPVRELWNLPNMARMTARFLHEHLGLRGATVLTHSMGGLFALHIHEYLRSQKREPLFGSMHLIAPGALKLPPEQRDATRRNLYPGSTQEIRELLKKIYYKEIPEIPELVLGGFLREWSAIGNYYLAENTVEQEDAAFFQPPRLRALRIKPVFYWGKDDGVTLLKWGRQLKNAIPGSKLHVFDEAGHGLHLEKPREFFEKFRKEAKF